MNEHEKQRMQMWMRALIDRANHEFFRGAGREEWVRFADDALAEFDKRFPAPSAAPVIPQPHGNVSSAMGYAPAPSDSRVEKQVAVTGRAEAWDLSKAIEKLRGSVFHPNHVEQMLAGKEYVVKGREKKGDTTILHMESVPLPVADEGGADQYWIKNTDFKPGIGWELRLSSDRPVNDGVTTTNYRLNEAERTESAEGRMWRASKSFNGGQV